MLSMINTDEHLFWFGKGTSAHFTTHQHFTALGELEKQKMKVKYVNSSTCIRVVTHLVGKNLKLWVEVKLGESLLV